MTDTTTILISAIVALAGVIGVGGKMLLKVLRENTRAPVTVRVHNVSTGSANYSTSETYKCVLLKY